uniref:Zinc finger protein n=1 Tax=Syphacia muris TaxID=451379 RepID=A0A0N5AYG3_9BILA
MQRESKKESKKVGDLACSMCSKRFLHLSHLQRHQLSHLNVREYECPMCSKAFVQKVHLDAHLKWTHHSTTAVTCSPSSSNSSTLTVKPSLTCKICKVEFRSKWHLNRHNQRRHLFIECDLCNEVFESVEMARAHKATHDIEKSLVCKTCLRRFSRLCDLRTHEFVHSRQGTFLCVVCNSVFIQRTQLIRHLKCCHQYQRNCDVCAEKFTAIEQFVSHMQIIHDKITCKICGDDDNSKEHMETMHWKRLKTPLPIGVSANESKNTDSGETKPDCSEGSDVDDIS